jgi:hypothetical protein
VLVVKPIARRKIILRQSVTDGAWDVRRLSPKTGTLLNVFDDLVHFTRVFPHPNLTIEIVLVDEEEFRVPRARRRFRQREYRIHDRRLISIVARRQLVSAYDLLDLLPPGSPDPMTTESLAAHMGCQPWFARRVAYTLRHCGAARITGKVGNRLVYRLNRRAGREDSLTAC